MPVAQAFVISEPEWERVAARLSGRIALLRVEPMQGVDRANFYAHRFSRHSSDHSLAQLRPQLDDWRWLNRPGIFMPNTNRMEPVRRAQRAWGSSSRRRLLAATPRRRAILLPGATAAHEGHDHDKPAPLNLPIAPRVVAVTPDYELVGVLSGEQRLTIFLHHFATGEPVKNAKILSLCRRGRGGGRCERKTASSKLRARRGSVRQKPSISSSS